MKKSLPEKPLNRLFVMLVVIAVNSSLALCTENTIDSSSVIIEPYPYLSKLIGRPAPGFESIRAWKNTKPLRIEELRGRYILLDFWGYWCGPCLRDMPHLMIISKAFPENNLTAIAVHDDSVTSLEEMDRKLRDIKNRIWMGNDIEFPIALDGGGETRIEGSDNSVKGATTAAYGIQNFPTTILIGPDGNVRGQFHAPSLEEKIRGLEKLLNTKARKPEWHTRFYNTYRLKEKQLLRYVPKPLISERRSFYFYDFAYKGLFFIPIRDFNRQLPKSEVLDWDPLKEQLYSEQNDGGTIADLLRAFGIRPWEYEGSTELLQKRIPGDWVKRKGVKPESLVNCLVRILNEQRKMPIVIRKKAIDKEVVIAKGRFEFRPLSGDTSHKEIHLFIKKPDPFDNIRGGGGSGSVSNLLDYLGRIGKIHIINQCQFRTDQQIQWRQHSSAWERIHTDPASFDALLEIVSSQTSLQFQKERRIEDIWSVKLRSGEN